jgi:hypothetical protein
VKTESEDVMHIDCDTCEVKGLACGDCVVTYLLGSAPDVMGGVPGVGGVGPIELDHEERAALAVLAASGLVPPLRLVQSGRQLPDPAGNAARPEDNSMKSAG